MSFLIKFIRDGELVKFPYGIVGFSPRQLRLEIAIVPLCYMMRWYRDKISSFKFYQWEEDLIQSFMKERQKVRYEGYSEGYSEGKEVGRKRGYEEGVETVSHIMVKMFGKDHHE